MYTHLPSVQTSEAELTLNLDEANKLAQELSNRKKELKAAMFDNKLASFIAFTSIHDVSLGELAFTDIQLPFKKLHFVSTDLKPVPIQRDDYDFLLPLEHGQRIVAFRYQSASINSCIKMRCFDLFGRMIRSNMVVGGIYRQKSVSQCGPNQFVMCHDSFRDFQPATLSVYDSALRCLRTASSNIFSNICSNSKFVFGLFDRFQSRYDVNKQYSSKRIQVLDLDTLSEAFGLRVPQMYKIERIVADEYHVVAICCLSSEPASKRFMSVFNLQTYGKESDGRDPNSGAIPMQDAGGYKAERFFLAERHIDLHKNLPSPWLEDIFLLRG